VAIGTDQGTRYVLVAGSGGVVEYRSVSLGVKAASWRVVDDAIRPGDHVVLPGLPGLRPGLTVDPVVEVLR
jgi:gold/copper resistance efflux system membrane fusion protein